MKQKQFLFCCYCSKCTPKYKSGATILQKSRLAWKNVKPQVGSLLKTPSHCFHAPVTAQRSKPTITSSHIDLHLELQCL